MAKHTGLENIGSPESVFRILPRGPAHRFQPKAMEMLGFSGPQNHIGEWFEIERPET
jgi:hypothetical protein